MADAHEDLVFGGIGDVVFLSQSQKTNRQKHNSPCGFLDSHAGRDATGPGDESGYKRHWPVLRNPLEVLLCKLWPKHFANVDLFSVHFTKREPYGLQNSYTI